MSRLEGKTALVTGGSRGIGAAIARRLALEGANVALTYTRSAQRARAVVAEIEAAPSDPSTSSGSPRARSRGDRPGAGRRSLAIAADNMDPAAIEGAVAQTVAEFGQLDILVNNAGIFSMAPLEAVTLQDFDAAMAVNLRAVFIASQAAARSMSDGGRIISIGSNLAERVAGPGLSLYAASKAALVGLTKGMARDLGPRGITVNIVHPGSTDTDMNPAGGPGADEQRRLMAIPRYGKPEEVASLVAYLASAEARFVTGAALTVDGGANA